MLIVSSTVGSLTITGWNRRSSAASFSMYFAVLVERGGADRVQLAAREHRLEHVRRVHRAFGRAGADHGVQLVDEQDDEALRVGNLLEDRLQALFELAAVFRARDERAHVERDDALVLQPFRHVAADDAAGQAFDDGGLADARLADEDGIVLRPARQHLDDAPDLLVTADHRIELALAGQLGQVAAVALERLVGALGVLVGHALRAAHAGQRLEDPVARDAVLRQQLGGRGAPGFRGNGDEEVLGADVLVLEAIGFGLRQVGDQLQPRRQARLRAAVRLRHLLRRSSRALARNRGRVDAHLPQAARARCLRSAR